MTGMTQDIVPPECYGGVRQLKDFIMEEMVYPADALRQNIEGLVEISFTVKADGTTTGISVTKPVSPEIDTEALRIFDKILWMPGTHLGKPKDMQHAVTIRFDIKRYHKACKARGYDAIAYSHEPVDPGNRVYQSGELDIYPKPVYDSKNYNFEKFVENNMKYPEAAFKQNVSGTVKLGFVVEPSGRLSNIRVEQHVGGGCNEEAVRLVKLLRWTPGIVGDMAVRCYYHLDITFKIAGITMPENMPTPGTVH
jgi:TonB family protein